jgi:hypothetical protein
VEWGYKTLAMADSADAEGPAKASRHAPWDARECSNANGGRLGNIQRGRSEVVEFQGCMDGPARECGLTARR